MAQLVIGGLKKKTLGELYSTVSSSVDVNRHTVHLEEHFAPMEYLNTDKQTMDDLLKAIAADGGEMPPFDCGKKTADKDEFLPNTVELNGK